jgi:DNA-binding IclR family transcriptional regulator
MDFLYERQIVWVGELQKVVIIRSVCESFLSHERGCNTSSLSDSLMIPRETVRRKCKELARDGWLIRDGNEFQPGPSITQEVLDLVDESIDRLTATADKVRKLGR